MIYKTHKNVHNINLHIQSNPTFFKKSFEPLKKNKYELGTKITLRNLKVFSIKRSFIKRNLTVAL